MKRAKQVNKVHMRGDITPGESILTGLREAIAWSTGKPVDARETTVHVPDVDVQTLRQRLGLGQAEFAARFGFSTASVRNWEQHRRRPETSARILLAVIDRYPEVVERVLETPD
jgi:putative transcriptional regulator